MCTICENIRLIFQFFILIIDKFVIMLYNILNNNYDWEICALLFSVIKR